MTNLSINISFCGWQKSQPGDDKDAGALFYADINTDFWSQYADQLERRIEKSTLYKSILYSRF